MTSWEPLYADAGFLALPLAARAVYQYLHHAQDGRGEWWPARGQTVLASLAVVLRAGEDELAGLLSDLDRAGMVVLHADRVELRVRSRRSTSSADRTAKWRASKRAAGVTSHVTRHGDASPAEATKPCDGGVTAEARETTEEAGNVTFRVTRHIETVETETAGDVTPIVTAEIRENASESRDVTNGDGVTSGLRIGATPSPPLPPSVSPSPSPVSPLSDSPLSSLSLTLSPPSDSPLSGTNAGAQEPAMAPTQPAVQLSLAGESGTRKPAPKPSRKPKPVRPDAIPGEGTLARRVHDAIVSDPVLGPTTKRPGEFASRISRPEEYPGVDVLAQVLRCGTHFATATREVKDGNATLTNWLSRRAEDVARSGAAAPQTAARSPPVAAVGAQPPAPREAFAEATAAGKAIGRVLGLPPRSAALNGGSHG